MDYSPIIISIISLANLIIVVNKAFQKENYKKGRLIFFMLMLLLSLVMGYGKFYDIFANTIFEQIYLGFQILVVILLMGTISLDNHNTIVEHNHHQLFLQTLKESKYNIYYALDNKKRIKEISSSLCNEFNIKREDALGKKFYQLLNENVRVIELNQTSINNRQFERYFEDYQKVCKPNDIEKIELLIANYKGEEVLFHLSVQPIFVYKRFKGLTLIGEKKSSWELLEVEKDLKQTNALLESVSNKFVAILEVTNEGLFEIDLDTKSIWVNDELTNLLNLPSNSIDLTDFQKLIDESDRQKYLAHLGQLTKNNPSYSFSYRIFNGKTFEWFKETGKRIFDEYSSSIIMGSLNQVKTKHFQASNIDVVDNLLGKNELLVFMKKLFLEGKYFQLMLIDLVNLKQINESFDRAVGNMIMGEYIKKIKQNFITESGDIFRISGTIFALILTNPSRISVLEKGVRNQNSFLNYQMTYGSITAQLEVFAGIASSSTDAQTFEQLYENALQALKLSKHERFDAQALYFKDLS